MAQAFYYQIMETRPNADLLSNPGYLLPGGHTNFSLATSLPEDSNFALWHFDFDSLTWKETEQRAIVSGGWLLSRVFSTGWFAAVTEYAASTVTGNVVRGNATVPHARVSLLGINNQALTQNFTDAQGAFQVPYKPLGTFNVSIEVGGQVYRGSRVYNDTDL